MGLCCPAACELWLSEPCEFISDADSYEADADENAEAERLLWLIDRIVKGNGTLGERFAEIIGGDDENAGLFSELRKLYSSIEVLDVHFPERFSEQPTVTDDKRFINLAAYFIFRYYFELGEELTIKFTAASLIMIAAMGGDVCISAKDYSKEVEYDTDNLDVIYGFLSDCRGLAALCRRLLAV